MVIVRVNDAARDWIIIPFAGFWFDFFANFSDDRDGLGRVYSEGFFRERKGADIFPPLVDITNANCRNSPNKKPRTSGGSISGGVPFFYDRRDVLVSDLVELGKRKRFQGDANSRRVRSWIWEAVFVSPTNPPEAVIVRETDELEIFLLESGHRKIVSVTERQLSPVGMDRGKNASDQILV